MTKNEIWEKKRKERMLFIEKYCSEEHSSNDKIVHKTAAEEWVLMMKKLPDVCSDVLVLSYIYNLGDKQIAKVLDISLAAVRIRKERGSKQLYSMLTKGEINDRI